MPAAFGRRHPIDVGGGVDAEQLFARRRAGLADGEIPLEPGLAEPAPDGLQSLWPLGVTRPRVVLAEHRAVE